MTVLRISAQVATFIIVTWAEVELMMHYLGGYLVAQSVSVRILALGACVMVAWLVGRWAVIGLESDPPTWEE